MTEADIARVQNDFVAAAKRALAAGFEWLELHAAHGYLFNEFLSPLANHRTDQYGGSFENRIRLLLDTTRAVRKVWPDKLPLAVRISAIDWKEGGWQIEDSIALAKLLKAEGVDLMDCSSGGVVPDAKITVKPGYQVPFAEKIRQGADIATAAVGFITEPKQADDIVRNGQADVVLLARQMLVDHIGRRTRRRRSDTNCRRQTNTRGLGEQTFYRALHDLGVDSSVGGNVVRVDSGWALGRADQQPRKMNKSEGQVIIAALMPHAPVLVPAVGGKRGNRASASVGAMAEAARRIVKAKPETVVLISPHTPRRRGAFAIWAGERIGGSLAQFGAPAAAVDLPTDEPFGEAIAEEAGFARLGNLVAARCGAGSRCNGSALALG